MKHAWLVGGDNHGRAYGDLKHWSLRLKSQGFRSFYITSGKNNFDLPNESVVRFTKCGLVMWLLYSRFLTTKSRSDFLSKYHVDVLYTVSDRMLWTPTMLAALLKRFNIPVVYIQTALVSKKFLKSYRKWWRLYFGNNFYGIHHLLMLKVLGITHYDVWNDGNSFCDHRLLWYRSPNYDDGVLFSKSWLYDVDERGSRDLIVFAVPQFYEHGFLSMDESTKIISTIIEKLHVFHENLVLSLHPKMSKSAYIDRIPGIEKYISDKPLIELLVKSKCTISSFQSVSYDALALGSNAVFINYQNKIDLPFKDRRIRLVDYDRIDFSFIESLKSSYGESEFRNPFEVIGSVKSI